MRVRGQALEKSWRKTLITAAVANGLTSANASSVPARTAPKRETEAKRLSAGAVGRTPFSNQTWVARPFCPTRASSSNQSCRSLSGCSRAIWLTARARSPL